MKLKKITDYLDDYLEVQAFSDLSANGLQVENSGKVKKIGLAVDAGLEVIERAAAENCDLLIIPGPTHHVSEEGRLTRSYFDAEEIRILREYIFDQRGNLALFAGPEFSRVTLTFLRQKGASEETRSNTFFRNIHMANIDSQ